MPYKAHYLYVDDPAEKDYDAEMSKKRRKKWYEQLVSEPINIVPFTMGTTWFPENDLAMDIIKKGENTMDNKEFLKGAEKEMFDFIRDKEMSDFVSDFAKSDVTKKVRKWWLLAFAIKILLFFGTIAGVFFLFKWILG